MIEPGDEIEIDAADISLDLDSGGTDTLPIGAWARYHVAPKVSIVDQLAKLNIKPDQIKYVGISHYHADHTGQVGSFPKAELLIGTGDWDAIIVTHSSFERIGMSADYQERFLRDQIREYESLLVDKASSGRNIIKNLEKQKASKEERLKDLLAESDVVTLHVDGRQSNQNFFGEAEFATMKPGAKSAALRSVA